MHGDLGPAHPTHTLTLGVDAHTMNMSPDITLCVCAHLAQLLAEGAVVHMLQVEPWWAVPLT